MVYEQNLGLERKQMFEKTIHKKKKKTTGNGTLETTVAYTNNVLNYYRKKHRLCRCCRCRRRHRHRHRRSFGQSHTRAHAQTI